MAEALGCHGEYVEKPDDIRPALERAFAAGCPAVVNVEPTTVLGQPPASSRCTPRSSDFQVPSFESFLHEHSKLGTQERETTMLTLVQGATVIQDATRVITGGAVAFEGDRIEAVGSFAELRRRWPDAPVLGGPDRLVMPV